MADKKYDCDENSIDINLSDKQDCVFNLPKSLSQINEISGKMYGISILLQTFIFKTFYDKWRIFSSTRLNRPGGGSKHTHPIAFMIELKFHYYWKLDSHVETQSVCQLISQ